MIMAESVSECPICSQKIPLKHANEHIDECLKTKSPLVESKDTENLANAVTERKKQSLLTFSSPPSSRERCLNPMKKRKVESEKSEVNGCQ